MTPQPKIPSCCARPAGTVRAALALCAALLTAAPLLLAPAQALAQTPTAMMGMMPQPQNVVMLSASATVEVPQDWLTIVFAVTREGADAAAVQSQLNRALEAALTQARSAARPGQLEVRTGAFSLFPRYSAPRPGTAATIAGWQGTAELVVEGRDTAAISALPGRLATMQIQRVGFSLSREAREKVQAEVTAQAIERFRARAGAVARQFGFNGYTLREVSVDSAEPPGMPVPMARMQASAAMADESLPVEAGRSNVSATVSGSVQLQ